jgi:acyl transferase domain-containing protein
MLSPSYRCKFGDNDADGYVRGEGVGAFLLERGSHGVVGIGIGQDGRSNGLTAPNPKAQQAVLRAAYATYDGNVALIEAHGTGTKLGDPIELGALGKHFPGMVRTGSVKTNIGHLEGCSGLVGLAKACHSLREGVVPRSLHFRTPNTAVDWSTVRVVAENEDLGGGAVGVSSFGFGGALGHVVVTGTREEKRHEVVNSEALIVPLEAHSSASLRATCKRIKVWSQNENVDDVANCLVKRSSLNKRRYRTAAVVPAKGGRAALAAALETVAINEHEGDVALVFVFTGQGAAYAGAVTSLLGDAAFREAYEEAIRACGRHMDIVQLDRLGRDATADTLLDDASIAQPYGFCMAYALAKALLAKTTKTLDAVVGHSLGEIAANLDAHLPQLFPLAHCQAFDQHFSCTFLSLRSPPEHPRSHEQQ